MGGESKERRGGKRRIRQPDSGRTRYIAEQEKKKSR